MSIQAVLCKATPIALLLYIHWLLMALLFDLQTFISITFVGTGLEIMHTKHCPDWSKFLGGVALFMFFTKSQMAGNLSNRKLWVLEANMFIMRSGISVQNLMPLGQTGREI